MIEKPLAREEKIMASVGLVMVIVMFAIFVVGIVTVNGWLVDFFHGGTQ